MDRKRKWAFIPFMIIAIILAGALAVRLYKGISVSSLLKQMWEQDHQIIRVHMESPMEFENAILSWDTLGNERYYTVNIQNEIIYLHNHELYFSNGNGYRLDRLLNQLVIPDHLQWIFPFLVSWEHDFDGGYHIWKLSLPEDPGFLIRKLIPDAALYWSQLNNLTLGFYEQDGALRYILIQNESIYLYLEIQNEKPEPVPTDVVMRMGTQSLPDLCSLEPLIRSCMAWSQENTVYGDLKIQVDCGPLPIEEFAKLKLNSDGLYFSRDNQWTELTGSATGRQELILALGWVLIRDGSWNPTDENSGTATIIVSSEKIMSAIHTILPELENAGLILNDGIVTINISNNHFSSIKLTTDGELTFLVLNVPLFIHLELTVDR